MNTTGINITKAGSPLTAGTGSASIKTMALCGLLASLLYVGMNLVIPMLYEGYDSASQTVSEMSAVDAPTRVVWVAWSFIYSFLMIVFAWGIVRVAHYHGSLRITGILLLAYGIISLGWPFAPMHLRPVLAAGGSTWSDTLHLALAGVSVVLMLSAMGFGAKAFGKGFKWYTLISMATLLVFGLLTSKDAKSVEANLPTPWIGVWERINIGVFILWVIVVAVLLINHIQSSNPQPSTSIHQPSTSSQQLPASSP